MIVVGYITGDHRLSQILRRGRLSDRRVESRRLVLQKARKAAEVELAVRVGGSHLIILQPLERESTLDAVSAVAPVHIVIDLVGVVVKQELSNRMQPAGKVTDAPDIDKSYRKIRHKS